MPARISTKPPEPIAVRHAVADDIPRLIAIRAAVRENRLSDPRSIAASDYEPFIADGHCWVAEQSRAILGFAALDAASATIWALFVAPEAEGRGAGRLLLDTLVGEARRLGLPELRLTTEQGTRADRLYCAAGWITFADEEDGTLLLRLVL